MKKINLKFLLLIVAIALVSSCVKELIDIPKDALVIEKAKAWYDSQNTTPVLRLKSSKASNTNVCIPDWKNAFASNNNIDEVVETSLLSQICFGFSTEESISRSKKENENSYKTSLSRFIFRKNLKSGQTDAFIMTIIGDADYLKSKKFLLKNNTYFKKDKDFCGYVLFHNLNGYFTNGWKYKDGKVIGSMTLNSANKPLVRLKSSSSNCTDVYLVETTTTTITLLHDDGTLSYDTYVSTTEQFLYTICPYIGDGGGGGAPSPEIILQYLDENPCLKKLYLYLMAKNTLPTITQDYAGFTNGQNLSWKIGNLYNANGSTYPQDDNNTTIYLDRQYCNTASGFAITQTIIHEALHALFFAQINSAGGTNVVVGGAYDFLNDNNFITLFNYYEDHRPTGEGAQHEAIADVYRNTIISGLKEYDAKNGITTRTDDEYNAMSWAGLMDTNAWNSFHNNANTRAKAEEYLRTIQFYKEKKEVWESTNCN